MLEKVRRTALRTVCETQLKTIGNAIAIYADDYESLKILFKSQYLENFLQHCTDIKIIEKSELEKL